MKYIHAGSVEDIRNTIRLVENEDPAVIEREIRAEQKGQNRTTVIKMLEAFKRRMQS